MNGDFWQSFLMISDIYTVGFLILLCIFFGIIHYLYRKRKMDFSLVVLIGMGLGCILGIFMQYMAGFPNDPMQVTFIKETTNWLQLFGNGYIDLIKMIVVPLVIVSIAHVIVNMKSEQKMSRLVKKTILVTMFYGSCGFYSWYSFRDFLQCWWRCFDKCGNRGKSERNCFCSDYT